MKSSWAVEYRRVREDSLTIAACLKGSDSK
jgi:hypothetical protein